MSKKGNPKRFRHGGRANAAVQRILDVALDQENTAGAVLEASDRSYAAMNHRFTTYIHPVTKQPTKQPHLQLVALSKTKLSDALE